MLHRYSCFSWWWAHRCPKHVEKRNKYTKKNCAPSWLYLQDIIDQVCTSFVFHWAVTQNNISCLQATSRHFTGLNDLYSLPNIVRVVKSRRMRWAGHVARTGEDRGVHRVLVGKPEGKRPLGRPRCRWEANIKMDLQEVGGGHGDWMELAQDRDKWRAIVGTVRDFRVP